MLKCRLHPSKTLLEHGEKAHSIRVANDWGITTKDLKLILLNLSNEKESCTNTYGWREAVVKENKVTYIEGEARISKNLKVDVNNETYQAKDIILATGSQPFIPPIDGLDQVNYETTDTFFDLEKLPKQLAVIGGGVIATELASSMADLGVRVTIIEVADDILLTEINETREMLKAHLDNQGIKILTKAKIKQVKESKIILDGQDDVSFDTLLVATGRQPNTQVAKDLNLEMDGKFFKVNEHYETSQNMSML